MFILNGLGVLGSVASSIFKGSLGAIERASNTVTGRGNNSGHGGGIGELLGNIFAGLFQHRSTHT